MAEGYKPGSTAVDQPAAQAYVLIVEIQGGSYGAS